MTRQHTARWVPIDAITAWDKNPRNNDHAVEEVAKSIGRFGWGNPIIARKSDGVVIAGHTRLKAAKHLNMDKVLVRYLDLDPAEAAALAIADNKIGEIADWDDDELREILMGLDAEDVSLDGLGFTDEQMQTLIANVSDFGDEWADALGALPEGDREPIQTMNFTLHDDQVDAVKRALRASKLIGDFVDTGNENGNGNALARICELWMMTQ